MTQITIPSFAETSEALENTTHKMHASQAHGLLTGVLVGKAGAKVDWKELVAGEQCAAQDGEIIQFLHESTAQQLKDFLFEFQLLLPSDEEDLPVRAEGLSLWCQGFITGLKVSGVKVEDRPPSDMSEAITDLIEIARMEYEEVVENEEDEAAYTELVEFVRMAVILIYQESHATNQV